MPAGYSGTPLWKKLGIKENGKILLIGAPPDYLEMIEPVPQGVQFVKRISTQVDISHIFADRQASLSKTLATLRRRLRPTAVIWVSWPKKSSKVATDITEDRIREIALPMGLVDVKVCAVSEVWSALKLVVRKELR